VVNIIFLFFHNKNGSEEDSNILKALNLKLCRKKNSLLKNNEPKKEAEKGRKRFCDKLLLLPSLF
jgi:hypothetical protein